MARQSQAPAILVTGGNGLLGTKLLELALRHGGIRPISVSRQPCANGFLGEFAFHQVDVADAGAVLEVVRRERPTGVVHTAAMTDVDGCERDPEGAWRANVLGAQAVAAACRDVGAHLVHLSTEYVFDGQAGPYSEDDPVHAISVYGRSKLASEEAVMAECPNAAIGRTTVLYGCAPNVRKNFVLWLLGELRAGRPVRVVDDQIGSPTLADNLAEMCLTLSMARAEGIYHTVGADVINRYRFARLTAEVFGLDAELVKPISTASLHQPAPRPLRAGLKMDKFRRDFPHVPVLGAGEGLEVLRRQLAEAEAGG